MEFAILAPLLFLIIFGIVEFGTAFNDYQSIRQGAREGARQAVVRDYGTDTVCGLDGSAAMAIDDVKSIICQTKNRTGLGDTVKVAVRVTDAAPSGRYENNTVKVCVVRNIRSITGFLAPFTDDRPLKTEIDMRAEKAMGAVIDLGGTWQEVDPSGEGWSWC